MTAAIHTNGASACDIELDSLYAFWPAQPPAPAPLGEAPVSVNCRVTLHGRDIQITLRGVDELDVLARLEKLLSRYPVPEQTPTPREGWCSKHGMQMKQHEKEGRRWWSHYIDGNHCKGR